jgi:integral membrane sensor domain MASE1
MMLIQMKHGLSGLKQKVLPMVLISLTANVLMMDISSRARKTVNYHQQFMREP